MIKKFFAIFLAITVIPSFQTFAWIGGPFSNNSFTPGGDDGIYEAVAVPRPGGPITQPGGVAPAAGSTTTIVGASLNGVGLYRWAVQNNNPGRSLANQAQFIPGGIGNVQFGGMLGVTSQHVWYINGGVYYGVCFGTVNSIVGTIRVVGTAQDVVPLAADPIPGSEFFAPGGSAGGAAGTSRFATSLFSAQIRRGNYFHAGRNFQGSGTVSTSINPTATLAAGGMINFPITVFGSRVSYVVTG